MHSRHPMLREAHSGSVGVGKRDNGEVREERGAQNGQGKICGCTH